MRRLTAFALVMLCLIAAVSASAANRERVSEIWRSRYGMVWLNGPDNVNQRDGSVWIREGATVTHFSRAGELLGRTPALPAPWLVAASPADGTGWIAQRVSAELTHVASDGRVLSVTPGLKDVERITVSPYDGSVWALGATWMEATSRYARYLAHVSADGRELSRAADFRAVVVDPADGRAFACSDTATVRLRADGTPEWTAPVAGAVIDEDPRDGSVWVVSQDPDTFAIVLTHLAWSGYVLTQTAGPAAEPADLHVSHTDRSAWMNCSLTDTTPLDYEEADREQYTDTVLRFDSSGAQVGRLDHAIVQACNDRDGSVWVYQLGDAEWESVQYSAEMQEIRHFTPRGAVTPWRSYDQAENAFWATADVSETGNGPWEFQRVGPDGTVLWHERMLRLSALWQGLDPRDGSIWAEDRAVPGGLVHYSPQGEELGWRPPLPGVEGWMTTLLISPLDGSWWLSTGGIYGDVPVIYHLAADGTLLSSFSGIGWDVALDERDGSVWGMWGTPTPDGSGADQYLLHHLAADGAELLTKEYAQAADLAGVAADGSVWILLLPYPDSAATRFEHLSAAGDVIGSVVPALPAGSGLVSPTDGSFYAVACTTTGHAADGWVGRMASDGSALWKYDGFWFPEILLNPDDGSLWVADTGGGPLCSGSGGPAVVHYAADGTERWRGRAFAYPFPTALDRRDSSIWISDACNEQLVHLSPRRSPFIDVPEDHWAFNEIVDCFEAGIVMGFGDDTYRPGLPVTRDAMAVYIARALAGGDEYVPTGPATATFEDVPNTGYGDSGTEPYWAYQYIEYCVDHHIVEGYSPTHYQPTIEVDRGQMAVYVARALISPTGDAAIPDPPASPSFHDVTADNDWSWCYRHVEYCVAEGVVQGYFDATYRPALLVTRDQMAVYVARAFRLPL